MAKKQKSAEVVEPEVMEVFDSQSAMLFEIAWEVCNQVGGIYTVIRSKVPSVVKKRRDNYCLIGPYFPHQVGAELEPITDLSDPIGRAVQMMRDNGYDVYYGHWLVTGHPKVVLFNPYHVYYKLGHMKYEFWEHHKISLSDDDLINKVVSFGYQVKEFFSIFCLPECN